MNGVSGIRYQVSRPINMNVEEIREYCLRKSGVTESFPFDDTTLVFKVMDKIFCMVNLDGDPGLFLKRRPRVNTGSPRDQVRL